jgi:hypothetical protein
MRLLLFASTIGIVYGSAADDLVAAVAKGDSDTVLQQVGHGTSSNEANSKGQLPLVLAGIRSFTFWQRMEPADVMYTSAASCV